MVSRISCLFYVFPSFKNVLTSSSEPRIHGFEPSNASHLPDHVLRGGVGGHKPRHGLRVHGDPDTPPSRLYTPAGCALGALLLLRGRPVELLLPPQVRERRLKVNEGFTVPRCTAFKYPVP